MVAAADRREAYVPNDALLDHDHKGMLLYGVNCAGKSCYMKAVGLAVVMAQAGLFVAADSMRVSPFASLHTRIWRGDDLGRGVSLFQNEMQELRQILRAAGPGALVLGDELCSGTEEASAAALVAAGVRELASRGARFLFATHLHRVAAMKSVADLCAPVEGNRGHGKQGSASDAPAALRIRHLSVHFCDRNQCLVYERRLRPGPGPDRYGIEVAKALDMGRGFIRAALAAYRELTGENEEGPATSAPTRYSRRVLKSATCDACGGPGASDTHHLVPRAAAEKRVRNRAHNLARLCPACHDRVHEGGGTRALRWVATSAGVTLEEEEERDRGDA
jgi:DNA mismatch repair protein MutS